MDIFNFDLATVYSFLLTIMRASLVIFMLPVFGANSLPTQWKAYFAIIFTFAIWPHISLAGEGIPTHPLSLILILISELMLGFTLGMCVQFFFSGIQAGGELIATQMGFTMISLSDPNTGGQVSVVGHLLNMSALLIFLALDGHLYLLKAFVSTYEYIPAGGLVVSTELTRQVLLLSATIFVFALKIVAPVVAALFLIEIALALMSKASPQMNIMEISFIVKIAVGFFFLEMLFTILGIEVKEYIIGLDDMFLNLIRSMSPLFQPF